MPKKKRTARNRAARDAALARESWRVLQIMSEFVEGFERMEDLKPAVSIFGSSRATPDHADYRIAEEIARRLSEAGFSVVSGGGPGIMEAVNKGAFGGPSPSIGLNIILPREQRANSYQDVSINFRHFYSRKVMFVKYAAAFVFLPGGFGTLDELAEILTLVQTGKTPRIPIILVGTSFWSGLLDWCRQAMLARATIGAEDLGLVELLDKPQEVVDAIQRYYKEHSLESTGEEEERQACL